MLLFDFPRILRFSFASLFNVFLLSIFYYIIICVFIITIMYIIITLFQVYLLQRIKTANEIWWYKERFFKLCFRSKCNLMPKMYIVVIWLSSYSSFFFLFTFQCFSSVCFLLFFDVFCTPPHNQENHDSK